MATPGSGCPPGVSAVPNSQPGLSQANLAQHCFCSQKQTLLSFCPSLLCSGATSPLTGLLTDPMPLSSAVSSPERVRGDCGVSFTSCRSQTPSARLCRASESSLMWLHMEGGVGSLQGSLVPGIQMRCGQKCCPEALSMHLTHHLSPEPEVRTHAQQPASSSPSGLNGTLRPPRLGSSSGPPGLPFFRKGRDTGAYTTLSLKTKLGFCCFKILV